MLLTKLGSLFKVLAGAFLLLAAIFFGYGWFLYKLVPSTLFRPLGIALFVLFALSGILLALSVTIKFRSSPAESDIEPPQTPTSTRKNR